MGAWDGPEDKRAVTFSANPKTTAGSRAISRANSKHNVVGTAYNSGYNTPTSRESATEQHEDRIYRDKRRADWQRRQEQRAHQQAYQEKLRQKLNERKQQAREREKAEERKQEENRHKMVDGKNIEHSFKRNPQNGTEIEDVLHQQGFDGLPKVVTAAEFAKAVQDSGIIAARGIGARDASTLAKYESDLKTGKFYVNCGGGSVYGHGMYMASAKTTSKNYKIDDVTDTANAYGRSYGKSAVINMTLHPSSKIIDYNDLISQIKSDKSITSHVDEGVYAAKKGYDAINVNMGANDADYTVVLNRTKLIIAA